MADVDAFREEARRWLVANAPPAMRKPLGPGEDLCWGGRKTRYPPDVTRWLDVMAERGWTAPTWPREYGGGGLSELEGKVLAQ
ncbi:MAG: acyl-CoA dehydrogenase, partial [Deltaproteobacteria bacterium]